MDDGMTMTLLMVAAVDQLEAASTWLDGLGCKASNFVQTVQSSLSLVIINYVSELIWRSSIFSIQPRLFDIHSECDTMGDYRTLLWHKMIICLPRIVLALILFPRGSNIASQSPISLIQQAQ